MAQTTQEADGKSTMPPYYAFSTFKTFLRHMKPHPLPDRIDKSLLSSFAGGDQGRIMTSLRFLSLIDDKGTPSQRLAELIGAYETDQWANQLEQLIRANYAPMFAINLASASPGQFNETFRKAYPGAEEVVRKAMTFFVNAARDANIEISAHITKNKKPRAASGTRRRAKAAPASDEKPKADLPEKSPAKTAEHNETLTPRATSSFDLLAAFDPSDMTDDEQQAIWTLLRYLRRKETTRVPEARRQRPTKAATTNAGAKEAAVEPPP